MLFQMLWNMLACPLRFAAPSDTPKTSTRKVSIVARNALSGAELGRVELEETERVDRLCKLLSKQLHEYEDQIAPTQVQLVHEKRILCNGDTLLDAGLNDGAIVDVVLRRREGFVVTASSDCTSRLWDVESGVCFLTLEGHTGPVFAARPSPDKLLVATCSQDGTAKLWQAESGSCLFTFKHDQAIRSLSFSPDGALLAVGTDDGILQIYKVKDGECMLSVPVNETGPVRSVDFSPDGKSVVSAGGDDGHAHVWNVVSGKRELKLGNQEEIVLSASFSPDGHSIVTGCSDDSVQVWDVVTGLCKQELEGHDAAVNSAAFSSNGESVLTSSSDGTAKVWQRGDCTMTLEGHDDDVFSAAFSADASFIGTASADHTAKIWVARSGQCTRILEGHCAPIQSIEFTRA